VIDGGIDKIMANASYNTYQSPIDRAQTIRGNRLANDTRQIQSNTADLNNQKESRAVEQYDRALKTTTLARDSYELLTAAPEMREQLIRSYAEKDQTGFWKGTVNQSSENIQHMLENNVTRGQQLGAFGEAPKDNRSPELTLYQEGLNDPEFAKTQTNPPETYTDADGFRRDSLTNKRVNPNLKVAPEIYTDANGFKRDSLTNKRVNPNLKVAPEKTAKQEEIDFYMNVLNMSEPDAIKHAYSRIVTRDNPVSGIPSLVDMTEATNTEITSTSMQQRSASIPEGDTIVPIENKESLNLYNRLDSDATGYFASAKALLGETVGQFTDYEFSTEETKILRQDLASTQNNMIRALVKGRYTEGQARLILKELSIAPDKNLTSKKLGAIFKSIDRTIRQDLIQARSDTKNRWLDETDRNEAYIKQRELNKFIWNLGVPQTETTTQPNASTAQPQAAALDLSSIQDELLRAEISSLPIADQQEYLELTGND
tara:strand:- start:4714 stop:6171 length:1458 start_codon:yes stop_codon:yes gene_type:complete